MENWRKWERLSDNARLLDSCLQGCDCNTRCDCIENDNIAFKNDVLHVRKFTPPSILPVNKNGAIVMNRKGKMFGPYLYIEWLRYSYFLIDRFLFVVVLLLMAFP